VRELLADARLFRAATGWEPRVDLREGLARTAAWWRQRFEAVVCGGRRAMRRDSVPRRKVQAGLLTALLAGTVVCPVVAAAADVYRLQPGDVIAISVAGLSDMNLQAPVQMDGTLSVPLVGALTVTGLTLAEARAEIQTAIASRLLPGFLPDGREVTHSVQREQVSAAILSYRPVFVSGPVVRPGEVSFRPGMTVRQAVAAAGGILQAVPSVTSAISLRAAYAEAWHAALAASIRVWHLRRELGDTVVDFDAEAWAAFPEQRDPIADALRIEIELRDARHEAQVRERTFLEQTLHQADAQLAVLREQLEIEKRNEQMDADALATALKATSKGTYTQSRIAEVQSTALFSATRRLQTESNLMNMERRQTEVARDLERLDEQQRLDLLSELRDARVAEARDLAQLESATDALNVAGIASSGRVDTAALRILIVRNGVELDEAAGYDSPILPGDVLEISGSSGATPRMAVDGSTGTPAPTSNGLGMRNVDSAPPSVGG
jgi:polysaccharide export outer membrane protein